MSPMTVLVVVAVVLAAIAITAAVIAVRMARRARDRLRDMRTELHDMQAQLASSQQRGSQIMAVDAGSAARTPEGTGCTSAAHRNRGSAEVIAGKVVVHPTNRDVVDATMGRPLVRASALMHGLAHALRPQSRDRIFALMRREYRSRRRARLRAGRRAVRASVHTNVESGGEL